jgi:hypothetical protein
MHGLVFETSIWLLAGSTRLLSSSSAPQRRLPEGWLPIEKQSKVVRFGKELYDPQDNLRKLSSSVVWGLVLSWLATNWNLALKAQMGIPKCSLRASFLDAHLLPPGRSSRVEAGCALGWLADTIHTQSYNNLLFPQRGSHEQLPRLSRRGSLS